MADPAATTASRTRLAVARRIAAEYAALPAVAAIVVGGSTARGHADRYSDLELFVMWTTAPSDADRAGAIERAGGDLVGLSPFEDGPAGGFWADAWKAGRRDDAPFSGIEVDMSHCLAETVERALDDVCERFDPAPEKQLIVGGLLAGTSLHGEELVCGWQHRAGRYPDGLREAVVRAHAQIEGLWRLDAYCERENPVAGYRLLSAVHEELLHTLLGLNRVYYAGFKSLAAVCGQLTLAPADLLARLRMSYPLERGKSRDVLSALVEETYDLVEAQLPAIDVARLREFLRYERPLWDEPVD